MTHRHRQLVLDTETTGLKPEEGHRVIEIACVELLDRKLTGRHFHYYLNPARDIDPEAVKIHGLTVEFLKDKPFFADIAQLFLEFIQDSDLIIHNAPFDVKFLNNELLLWKKDSRSISQYCNVIDTLPIARKKHVGKPNHLDALCKRYEVDNSKRNLHGALLDANLLAHVYLAMTGGQGNFFDAAINENKEQAIQKEESKLTRSYQLPISVLSEEEKNAHDLYLSLLQKKGKCLWKELNDRL